MPNTYSSSLKVGDEASTCGNNIIITLCTESIENVNKLLHEASSSNLSQN